MLGKRNSKKANLPNVKALQQHYVRDYAFTETTGGTKGEKFDYLLIDSEHKGSMGLRYIPVGSKVKLNKRFRKIAKSGIEHPEDRE